MKKSEVALAFRIPSKPVVVANVELAQSLGGCLAVSESKEQLICSAGNGRRHFLNACLVLGAAGVVPENSAIFSQLDVAKGLRSDKADTRLIHLRHSAAAVGDANAYVGLRRALATHAISPGLRHWMEGQDESIPLGFDAIAEFRQDEKAKICSLLDYSEWYQPDQEIAATKERLLFDQWLLEYHPVGRDDCLMALPLFYLYQRTGVVVPTVRAVPDPWIDGLLQNTRGMLFWSNQWLELVRAISNLSVQGAKRLIRGFQLGRPDAFDAFYTTQYDATGQSLMQIIEGRSPTLSSFGSPDYAVGNWLHGFLSP